VQTLIFILVAGIVAWGVLIFNRLVRDRNQVRSAWSDLEVQLTRRHDLIPLLVDAVRAYAQYESATISAVTELRARAEATGSVGEKARLEHEVEAGMHRLVALAEAYPELKADSNFLQLQRDLVDTEDQLQYSRRFYNGAVRIYNTRIESFPDMLVAKPLAFSPAEFFALEADEARAAPRLELS
jgi:LemA protein